MTILIENPEVTDIHKILAAKKNKNSKKGNLSKHFGKLKRNFDGLEYQVKMRQNED